jgi:hypothetical protein
LVWAEVIDAKPYFLIADSGSTPEVIRTRAGDAFDALEEASCAVPVVASQPRRGVIDLNASMQSND